MYVGDCENGVKFIKFRPAELMKAKDILSTIDDDLIGDIMTEMKGFKVTQSGYAVMWKWPESGTGYAVVVYAPINESK